MTEGVGHQYGKGHSLSTKYMWISKFQVMFPDLGTILV
jgi:hypothetical protein